MAAYARLTDLGAKQMSWHSA